MKISKTEIEQSFPLASRIVRSVEPAELAQRGGGYYHDLLWCIFTLRSPIDVVMTCAEAAMPLIYGSEQQALCRLYDWALDPTFLNTEQVVKAGMLVYRELMLGNIRDEAAGFRLRDDPQYPVNVPRTYLRMIDLCELAPLALRVLEEPQIHAISRLGFAASRFAINCHSMPRSFERVVKKL